MEIELRFLEQFFITSAAGATLRKKETHWTKKEVKKKN